MENSSHHHHYHFSKGSTRREIMEQELVRGRDIANKLLEVLVHISSKNNSNSEEGVILPFAEDLVHEVLRSFTNTLLLLNTTINSSSSSDDVIFTSRDYFSSSSPPSCYQKHHHDEDLDEANCKSFDDTKSRIGRYKRKSTVPNWEKDSPILIEDGHAWRKYGQKKTMNSKYFRNYYRCTYKYEQGCPAIKQVQRIQEDPPLYRTTYFGHHNCKSTFNQEIILEPDDSFSGSSMFLSFNNSMISSKEQQHQFSSSPVFESTKQEPMEEVIIQDDEPIIAHSNQFPQSSSDNNNYFLLCDYYEEELDFNSF